MDDLECILRQRKELAAAHQKIAELEKKLEGAEKREQIYYDHGCHMGERLEKAEGLLRRWVENSPYGPIGSKVCADSVAFLTPTTPAKPDTVTFCSCGTMNHIYCPVHGTPSTTTPTTEPDMLMEGAKIMVKSMAESDMVLVRRDDLERPYKFWVDGTQCHCGECQKIKDRLQAVLEGKERT